MTRVHPMAGLLAGILECLDRELNRQDGGRTDLPPIHGTARSRGDLAALKAKAGVSRLVDLTLPAHARELTLNPPEKKPGESDTGARTETAA